MKQTAVEWLIIQMHTHWTNEDVTFQTLLEQAKAMEKEQIIEAFDEGQEYEYQYHINSAPKFYSETYYQETYKKD